MCVVWKTTMTKVPYQSGLCDKFYLTLQKDLVIIIFVFFIFLSLFLPLSYRRYFQDRFGPKSFFPLIPATPQFTENLRLLLR